MDISGHQPESNSKQGTLPDSFIPTPKGQMPRIPDHELIERIGRGSYGEVWLARNVMGTPRAVKIVFRDHFDHERPFDREFAGLKRYEPVSRSHESLVDILQIGRNDDAGCFYYVMELADNLGSLPPVSNHGWPEDRKRQSYQARTLRREIQSRGRMKLDECIDLATSLGSALGHLHKHGLVHRDLKPSNIILVNGKAKIADIGLVAVSGDESRSLVGTEGFFPPEGAGTPQSDLYSLGKVLYEAVTGLDRLHFPEMPAGLLQDPECTGFMEFNELLLKACDNDPALRYVAAEDLLADLALLRAGKSVRQLRRLERSLRWARRFGLLTLGLTLLSLAGYAYAKKQMFREREARERVQRAESISQHQLAQARLAQARAIRRTHESGQRFESLAVIRQAVQQNPSLELRNEAVGAFALVDLRVAERLPRRGISLSEPVVDLQMERYVCGDNEGNLMIRSIATDAELLRLPGPGHRLDWLPGFSPDGHYLAVRPTSDSLVIWDLSETGKVLEVPEQGREVFCRFLGNSQGVIWSAGEKPLRRKDFRTGEISELWLGKQGIWRFACSPDQRYLALAYADTNNLIEVIESSTGRIVSRLPHTSFVQGLEWHPTKPLVATGCYDRNVYLWNPLTGAKEATLTGHQDAAPALAFHPTRDLLASSSWDGTTRIWELPIGRQLVVLQEAGDNLQFSHDGQMLTFGEYSDAHALVCEVAGDTAFRSLYTRRADAEGSISILAFGPDDGLLAGGDPYGLQFLNLATGERVYDVPSGRVLSLWFEDKGNLLCTAGNDGVLQRFVLQRQEAGLEIAPPLKLAEAETDILFACRRGDLLAWTDGPQVRLRWNDGRERRLQTDTQMEHVSLSKDAQWVAASDLRGKSVVVWDTRTGGEWSRIEIQGRVRLAFSPDGVLVIGGPEEYVFWDPSFRKVRHVLPRYHTSSSFGKMCFSSDGKIVAVTRTRSLVALHSYPEMAELVEFESAHGSVISAMAFSPTDSTLAVANTMNEVQVWDVRELRRKLASLGLDWQ